MLCILATNVKIKLRIMKIFSMTFLLVMVICSNACRPFGKRIKGNGNQVTETRDISSADHLSVRGDFDVVLTKGATGVKVTADENLMKYIQIKMDDNLLVISSEDGINLSSENKITVNISTPEIIEANVLGSGNITSNDKFVVGDKMTLKTTGSGDINLVVNCPDVKAGITGSGNINLSGETRNLKVSITGSGNFRGQDLKSENADVSIAGSGDATVYADVNLKAGISGSGEIKYRGNATVSKRISGSGSVTAIN